MKSLKENEKVREEESHLWMMLFPCMKNSAFSNCHIMNFSWPRENFSDALLRMPAKSCSQNSNTRKNFCIAFDLSVAEAEKLKNLFFKQHKLCKRKILQVQSLKSTSRMITSWWKFYITKTQLLTSEQIKNKTQTIYHLQCSKMDELFSI